MRSWNCGSKTELDSKWIEANEEQQRRYEWVKMCDTKTPHKITVNNIVVILINDSQVS